MILYVLSVADWQAEKLDAVLRALPPFWRQKAEAIGFFRSRALSAASSLLLQQALEREGIDLSQLSWEVNPYGKPYFPQLNNFHFSVSHSGDWAVCGVGRAPLGVDVEKIQKKSRDCLALARRFFHPREYALLEKSQDPEGDFFRLWTLKESYVKFTGEGMHRPFRSFSFSLGPSPYLEEDPNLCLVEWDCLPGYRLALCSDRREPVELVIRQDS